MTTDVFSLKRHTRIYKTIRIMVENDIIGLPVVNNALS
ncbi:MAG: CBS domain-containing protein [Planctomycetota bacterium]|jgi:CBS domain-containing protein